jgi:hypothetical protein
VPVPVVAVRVGILMGLVRIPGSSAKWGRRWPRGRVTRACLDCIFLNFCSTFVII